MTYLEKAVDVVNMAFFGYKTTIGDINASTLIPSRVVRNAIKYQSLDKDSQDIWDDPNMLQAHKYQNIPQIDISYYMDDYVVNGIQRYPIELLEDDIIVTYVYSATNEFHEIRLQKSDVRYDKIMDMAHITRVSNYIETHPDSKISHELCLLIFGSEDVTDMVSSGNPSYGITVKDLYETFCKNPNDLYVPYRRGWSRILNIQPFTMSEDMPEFAIRHEFKDVVHIVGASAITTWDGFSTRIENHGVEVEDMKVNRIYDVDTMMFKMRCLNGTHEYIKDVTIDQPTDSPHEYFMISAIKGVNINGFEFNMP